MWRFGVRMWAVAAACIAVAAVVAVAAPSAQARSSGATVQHFSVTYPGGVATCAGNRIQQASGQTFIKDVETCIVIADFSPPAGTYDVNGPVVGGWCSDFDGFSTCNLAVSGHVTVTDNGDGTFTWGIVAYYAQP
jgi:hypothetical protein